MELRRWLQGRLRHAAAVGGKAKSGAAAVGHKAKEKVIGARDKAVDKAVGARHALSSRLGGGDKAVAGRDGMVDVPSAAPEAAESQPRDAAARREVARKVLRKNLKGWRERRAQRRERQRQMDSEAERPRSPRGFVHKPGFGRRGRQLQGTSQSPQKVQLVPRARARAAANAFGRDAPLGA